MSEEWVIEGNRITKLQFVITIEDEESIENYKDVHPELVLEDIMQGSLGEKCSMRCKIQGEL